LVSQVILQTAVTSTSLLTLLGPPIAELGFSGPAGYALGYFVKKIIKLLAMIVLEFIGFELIFLSWLESIGVITVTVNMDAANTWASSTMLWVSSQASDLTAFATTALTAVSVGFTGGFAIGLARA